MKIFAGEVCCRRRVRRPVVLEPPKVWDSSESTRSQLSREESNGQGTDYVSDKKTVTRQPIDELGRELHGKHTGSLLYPNDFTERKWRGTVDGDQARTSFSNPRSDAGHCCWGTKLNRFHGAPDTLLPATVRPPSTAGRWQQTQLTQAVLMHDLVTIPKSGRFSYEVLRNLYMFSYRVAVTWAHWSCSILNP
jgi:hypothetical protein